MPHERDIMQYLVGGIMVNQAADEDNRLPADQGQEQGVPGQACGYLIGPANAAHNPEQTGYTDTKLEYHIAQYNAHRHRTGQYDNP